jgi:phage baseplate assembly protein W
MGLNGKQLLENFKEDEAYGNTTYTPPDDSSDDDNGDNAWKYISAGDISGLADYTNRNYNYRTIPFLGQIVGHAADAATQGVADAAQFVGAQGVGDYLNEKAQEGEAELPAMSTPELSLAYLTDPNGLASAFGMMAGSMLSTAPVAAIAPELLPARAAMALSKVPKALSAVPKIGGALEEMAPMAGRFALTGPIEAMMEGGNTEREMLQNGATPEEARQAAWNVFGENVGLLTATNALEGGLLGKIKIKTPHFSNPVVNTASRVAGYVPTTAAEMALQGYEEGAQQGIQNGVEGESPNTANQILNPFAWTDDQWDAAKLGVAGAVPLMGAMGAIRHFGNRGDNGSTAADSLLDQAQDDIDSITSQAAQQSVIQSAQQDMENNPYTAPTAMQDTSYEAPSDTSSGSSYDASALEGDPQYTVSGEVSSTDVTPLTDQKMRLLDSAYYNKYGQHLFVTSMKRNGDGGSWHDSGQAFDTADDNLENNKEARDWLISEGEKLGLTPLDEYEHPSANATGGHIHFSDHGEPIPDGIRVGESDSDMDDSDMDDSTGGVDLSNLPVGDIAMAIAQNTNLPVNFIWSQLSHESDGGKSKLAVEDHNYGGVKGADGNYLHFDNDQQFIDYMSNYYPKYREDGIYDAKTADQFAEALQHGGYFTADLGEYEGGMHRYLEQAGLSQDAMSSGKARRASRKGGDNTSSTPDLSGSFEISADDPAMDSMFASFAKDWQNMSTDANEINFFGDMFNSRNKFKATEENKQAILDNYGDAFRQYVQENQPQTAQAPAQPKQAPQPQHIEMQTPNLQTITTPKVEATTIQNVLSSFVQDKKNVARTEQEANLFDDMLDADDHFIDTPKNRQTLLKNYGAQLQDYVDDAMTPSLTDRVNQAIEQAVQNKDLNRMNTLTQAKQANDTAALEKLVGPQTKQHVDIAAMLTPANTDMKNPVSSTVQANAPVYQTATMEHQAPQTEVASTVQGNVPVNQVAATEDEQKAFRKAGLVYRDSNYNGTERVKTAPLYEEGDRRMNGGKSETKVKAQTAGKADKYKKDAEKIYLRFKSGKFSTEDSIKQLNNLKKKATSDKALSDEDRADVITEADKHINRIKPQKETKEHETQKHSSKTSKTTQSGKAEGYPHQDAEPEKGHADAEESKVKTSSHFDTSDFKHTKTGTMIPAAKIINKVDADTYKAINVIAKKHGGYYNRYAKRFLFNKGGADGRDAFVEEAERSVFNSADSGTKESTPSKSDTATKRQDKTASKVKSDNQEVAQKEQKPLDVKQIHEASKEASIGEPIHGIKGTETTVVTDSGKEIRVRYLVVPASRVITSHDAKTMAPNKEYPQELQPRDRQRVSMQEQVTSMANELRPADLGAGRNLNQGAPIIRKDGVVLNGNGRAMAIQKATAAGGDKATAYRKYIFEHSKEFGLSRVNLAQARKYMLVREVVDDIDADTMQDIIGSTAGGSRMGASEQAKADAKKIKPRDLERYIDNEQGDLTTAANQDFVADILYRIVGKNERNAYTDEHGNVNADGIQRVKRALFSLAYDDDGLIDKMAESTDDNIRNVSRGLMNAAPAFARVNLAVADGQAYQYNADKTVSEAVKRLDALRNEGKPVKDYLNEQSMFSEYQDTDEVREVLRFLDENKRSGKKIGIFLNDMARSILEQRSPNQTSLMDGGRATLGEIIKAAERVARNGTTAASLFGNEEGSHVDVARSKASVQGDLKKIGKRVVFLPDNSLTSREKGIKEFGEKMGLKVVFFEGPSNLHGMYENGVSFINRSSSTSAPWTFWHETFHWLRHNNPELYRQMVSYIGKKQAFSSEQLQAYRDKTGRQALSDADVIEEMLADAMPDVHKRVSLFRNLGKADAPLLQRFVGWLRDAMRAFHDALTGRKAGLSETQKAAMRDALANIAADLRDSNGKHIFKVSGAEREITAADGTKLSYPARFSGKQETPTIFTAEDRLKADKKAWKGTLRKAWKGDMPDTTMLPVMQTPLVLKLVGAPDYPMVMRQSKLMKIKKDHPEVTKAILNELPSYLADPMIIFKSSTVSGRLVVGTELEDASGANIIVPIELNSKDGRMDVNVITSAYGKGTQQSGTNIAWFVNNIQAGNAVYINKKQAADFYQSAGLQLPMEGRRFNDLFGSSIKTDADLVKSRRENPVRYSLDANDNSTPSLFTRAYNHLTGRKDAASHDKNVKAMLEDITKMRIRFGKLDPATEIVFKKFEGVIRARNANEWERVLPEAGRAIADRLQLQPSNAMDNYIAKWLLDEAGNDNSQEATTFKAALKNDAVLSDQLVDLKTLFNERNNREADEVVRSAIQYEKPKERTTLTKAWQNFYDEMVEELGPVKRMVEQVQKKSGQELATSVNPYIALRLFRGNAGRAMTMIEGQSEVAVKALQTNYPGVNFNGFKTLHMILDECGALHNEKRMKDFLAFALACHVKDIHARNNRIRKSQQRLRDKIADLNDKINNLPEYQQLIESDKKVDDKYQEQREAYQKEIEGYQAKIDKAEKTIMEVPRTEDGLSLTKERCDEVIKKFRDEYGDAQQDLVRFSKVTTAILYDAGVISKKRYKELQDSWPNYIPMFRVFEDNEDVDFGDSLKHMHGSTRRIINPLDSIIRNTYDFVKKAEKNKARQLLADLTRISDVGEYIEEVDNLKPNDKTTITFYENGERKYLQTDPDIVKAVNNMGREESNWVLRLLHGPAKIARACFTTINPSFALRNLIRDSTDATIYSKYGFKPWDFVRGFLHAVHRDELFYEWLSSGAAQASAISLDRDYTQATLNQMSKTWKERLLSKEFLPAILEGMQMVGEYSEYGTRIAAYERVKKTLAGENGPHPAAYDLVSSALESRDLMDFARGGRGSRYLNNVVVFANASIQGFDKFFRTFDFRKPYRKESMKALARLFLCGMLPALLLAGIHSGDDWWEELPDWQKETNWILGKVGNTIIRIPKGQDIGLRFFSNLIEKAMDRSKHKAGDYFRPVWDSLPDMIPTALLPIIEATANHSYFTGAPVVPKYQEKLPAYLQFGNETSSFAKFVGKVIGVSPRKVEHVLFGYTGNMGKGLLGVYDTIVGNQSLNTNLNEAPVISGFTAIPYKQSKTVNDFYDKFDEQQRLNEEFKLTKKKPDGYDPSLYKRMTKAQQELSKINKQERAAIDDPKRDSGIREQKQLGYQQQRLSVVRRVMGQ